MSEQKKWKMSDEAALRILKRDKIYQKTNVFFDEALKNAIEALEEKIREEDDKK